MLKNYLFFISFIFISCNKDIVPQKYSLKVISNPENGGLVTPSTNTFDIGTKVSLTAKANTDFFFKQWQGDLSGNVNPTELIMDRDKSVVAVFEKKNVVSLKIVSPPDTKIISK